MNNNEEITKELLEKWDWILDGIDGKDERINTAVLLENSHDKMIAEEQIPSNWLETLNEAPQTSANVAPSNSLIPKVLFPVIRRVYPSLIANKLVSVQPLSGPTGMIYYLIYTFSNTKGNITKNNEYTGNINQGTPAYSTYYSSEKIGPFEHTVAAGTANISIAGGTKITDLLGTDASEFTIKRIEVYVGTSQVTTVRATAAAAPTTKAAWTDNQNVHYNASNGTITLKGGDSVTSSNVPWKTNDKLKVFVVYDQEGSDKIPDMEFSIGSDPVDTTERKLRVRWTKESEQDMKAYHKIDVESELIKLASMEMNYEIDREILTFINDQVTPALSITHDWNNDGGNNTEGNYLDRHRSLAFKLHQLSAKIAQYNRQGPANWAVVSPQVGAILKQLPDFKGEIGGGTFNVYEAGKLGGSLSVYVDPNRVASGTGENVSDEILVGYKSQNTTYGTGVVYAPYNSWVSRACRTPRHL